ncbi:glycosyl transferase family protein [Sneathiella sp. P13V-1]|uniref:glycosyl transferase family protein n=1 Tax=Sneathiella sp. P13V-1 TaxID=2697366 RepID=UPI00187B622B|nr:glycosyl transferase family protein [Sneathiella sp. P13V-1]MBE7635705.1 glycosyl transferase family protein [Sneathiella sp. P13V-1]
MTQDHPFSEYVRILGKGPNMWRDLTFDEAKSAMGMILRDEVEPLQLGAFLLLLRRKGETGEELAGMAAAAKETFELPAEIPHVDFDWPSYADRHRQQPWFILSAILLADQGYRVLMHGIEGYSDGFAPTRPGLDLFGIPQASSLKEATSLLQDNPLTYVGLETFCAPLQQLFDLRPLLGVRTAVNTFGRDLNPLNARCQMQGVFHPPYKALHLGAAEYLSQENALIFKGGGGEVMRNPMKPSRMDAILSGDVSEIVWPKLTDINDYKWREEDLDPENLRRLWSGELVLEVPTLAVIGTLAAALKMKQPEKSPDELDNIAREIWEARDKGRFN